MRRELATAAAMVSVMALAFGLGLGCTTMPMQPVSYTYFTPPAHDDAWSPKIAGWQRRERAEQGEAAFDLPAVAGDAETNPVAETAVPVPRRLGDLRSKYFSFRAERKRAMARDVAEWIQSQAKAHYVADGAIDHWATLEETLRSDGDDCDGLELLTFNALRELGFERDEVFRAIVHRPSDGQHHMVTLWFEDPGDPWVLDPTGAMTTGMPRMSDLPAWVPLKVFSDSEEFTVRRSLDAPSATSLAARD
jgi:predicted transglutaminase-like cysteine proteinase